MSTLTYKGLVMANETDSNQHMNVQFYTRKYDEATGILLTHVGTIKYLKQKNWGMAHIESNIKYLKEVLEDEALHILSKIVSISNKVITIEHEMYNTGKNELASTATFKLVFLDLKTRRAVPIPTEIKAKIEAIK